MQITMGAEANSAVHSSWLEVLADPVRLSVLRVLSEMGEATAGELIAHSHTSDPTLRRHLEAMVALGLVREHRGESDGLTPGRPAARFRLDSQVHASACALFNVLRRPLGPWSR